MSGRGYYRNIVGGYNREWTCSVGTLHEDGATLSESS